MYRRRNWFQSWSMNGWLGGMRDIVFLEAEIIGGLAELHHRFLVIHPFMDVNGRIAIIQRWPPRTGESKAASGSDQSSPPCNPTSC